MLYFLLRSECPGANIPRVLVIVEGILSILSECKHLEVALLDGVITGTILFGLDLILRSPFPGNGTQPVVLLLKRGLGLFRAADSSL